VDDQIRQFYAIQSLPEIENPSRRVLPDTLKLVTYIRTMSFKGLPNPFAMIYYGNTYTPILVER
jgi:hypothetical protein